MKFMICVTREGFGEFDTHDLTLGRLYEALDEVDAQGMIRIADDAGEDYLYPAALFEAVELPSRTAQRLHAALGAG